MVVHPNETWNDSVASEIENLGTRGHGGRCGTAQGLDFSLRKDHREIVEGSSTGAVYHACVGERENRTIPSHKGADTVVLFQNPKWRSNDKLWRAVTLLRGRDLRRRRVLANNRMSLNHPGKPSAIGHFGQPTDGFFFLPCTDR